MKTCVTALGLLCLAVVCTFLTDVQGHRNGRWQRGNGTCNGTYNNCTNCNRTGSRHHGKGRHGKLYSLGEHSDTALPSAIDNCTESTMGEGPSPLFLLKNIEEPRSEEEKCFVHCVMTAFMVMDKERKINMTMLEASIGHLLNSTKRPDKTTVPSLTSTVTSHVTACQGKISTATRGNQDCHYSSELEICIVRAYMKAGLLSESEEEEEMRVERPPERPWNKTEDHAWNSHGNRKNRTWGKS